ncbi:chorismate-binding protein [Formosa sp. A9]|uniref:chorismate-binding protein n=1 Tax=Formosa sp. A9 TaxID=3442641 RepID=UPI003EB7C061
MQERLFFDKIKSQFANQLPFVAYSKPNSNNVTGLFQNNNQLNFTETFTESGFVFAPFDDVSNAVLIPLEVSEKLQIEVDFEILEADFTDSKTITTENQEEVKSAYTALVTSAIQAIKSHAFEKVVLSREELITVKDFNIVTVLKKLLVNYRRAFVYCWYHPQVGLWLGATPETLLQIEGNRLTTMALAGTQVYKGTLEVDWGEKEIKEQQYVIDFIQSQLKPVVNTVSVSKVNTVKAGSLLHLQTQISAILQPETNLLNIVKALHPTPAVCGLPKANAKQFILQNEGYNRSFYTGFLGELNFKQRQTRNTNRRNVENNAYATVKSATHLFVNLRCMQVKNSTVSLYVGGGITKDSNPEAEYLETEHKTQTMKTVLF